MRKQAEVRRPKMKPEPQSGREVLSRDDDAMTQLLEEVINKVKQLGPAEQNAIAAVILAELEHAEWDKQIEQDLKAGKFDKLIKKMREDIAAGRAQPL